MMNVLARQNSAYVQQPWPAKTVMLGVLAYAFFSSHMATFQNISSQNMTAVSAGLRETPQLREATQLPDVIAPDAAADLGHLLPGMAKPARPNRPSRAIETTTPAYRLTPAFEAIDQSNSNTPEVRSVASNRDEDSGTNWTSVASTLLSLGLILYVRRRMSQYAAKQTSKGFSWLGQQLSRLAKRATAAPTGMGLSVPVNAKPEAAATSAPYSTPATVSGSPAPSRKSTAPPRESTAPPRKSVVSRR